MNSRILAPLSVVLALALAGALAYIFTRPAGVRVLGSTCASLIPANGDAVYGISLAAASGGPILVAAVHMYSPLTPGGFKHNVAYLLENSPTGTNGSGEDASLNCVDQTSGKMTFALTSSNSTSTWTITSPGTLSTDGNGGIPQMTGTITQLP